MFKFFMQLKGWQRLFLAYAAILYLPWLLSSGMSFNLHDDTVNNILQQLPDNLRAEIANGQVDLTYGSTNLRQQSQLSGDRFATVYVETGKSSGQDYTVAVSQSRPESLLESDMVNDLGGNDLLTEILTYTLTGLLYLVGLIVLYLICGAMGGVFQNIQDYFKKDS